MPVLRRSHRRSAYTLVEMAIVLLVAGILTAVAAPRYLSALASQRARSGARRVAADLRLVRQFARTDSRTQTVLFEPLLEQYSVATMPDVDHADSTYLVRLAALYGVEVVSAAFGGLESVQFDMYGRPNSAGSIVVRSGAVQRTITVDDVGNVQIP